MHKVSLLFVDRIDSIPCRASYFAPGWFEERDKFILFFLSSWFNSSYSLYCPGSIHPILYIVLVQFILFFKSFWCKIATPRQGIESGLPPPPQAAATTFALSSVFILLLLHVHVLTLPQVTEQADQAAVIQLPKGHSSWLQGRRERGSGRILLHFHTFSTKQITNIFPQANIYL